MKLWQISLWFSIASCVILLVVMLLPDNYTVFVWVKSQVGPGVLFPVLLISWTTALIGFACNNIYIDKSLFDKNAKKMPPLKTYSPTLLGIPAFLSFIWFVFKWYKGGDAKH